MTSSLDFGMALAISLLAVYDASTTESRIKKYGLGVELNQVIVWLAERLGLDVAIALGIMVPSLAISAVLAGLGLRSILAVWLGAKLVTARYQMISLKIEAEMDAIRLQQSRNGPTATSSLPSDDTHSGPSS